MQIKSTLPSQQKQSRVTINPLGVHTYYRATSRMEKLKTFLQDTDLFSGLEQQDLDSVAQDFSRREFKQGEIIFYEGDPGQVLYLVESGQVRIFVNGVEGTETSVILCGKPGQIFGELAVIDGLTRSATAIAIEPTVVHTLNRTQFREHMRSIPQLAFNFLQILSTRVRYNTKQVDSLASLDVAQRLARKLLELAKDYGTIEENGIRINTRLNQSDLASLIGATRESINKVMRLFRKQELIDTHQGSIVILDMDALRAQVTY